MRNLLRVGAVAVVVGLPVRAWAQKAEQVSPDIRVEAEGVTTIPKPLTLGKPLLLVPGSKWLEMPLDAKTPGVQVVYYFDAKVAGDYTVWARVRYLRTTSNKFTVALNGEGAHWMGFDQGNGADKVGWHWVGGMVRPHLRKGMNTLALSDMAPGLQIDRFRLMSKEEYRFSGRKRVK